MIVSQKYLINFNQWIDQHSDYLYAYIMLKIGHEEDAKDLLQETFIAAFKNIENFKGESSEKTWLVSIVKNKIIDYYRKKAKERPTKEYLNETEDAFDKNFFNENNYGRWKVDIDENYFSNSTDSYLQGKEFQTYLTYCIEKLPLKLRSVFIAKYIDDELAENICKENEITSSNYWTILFRSKTLLRICLEKKGFKP
jgi:RNA polymerase sigma-70 factor (TIGR02943 family)